MDNSDYVRINSNQWKNFKKENRHAVNLFRSSIPLYFSDFQYSAVNFYTLWKRQKTLFLYLWKHQKNLWVFDTIYEIDNIKQFSKVNLKISKKL